MEPGHVMTHDQHQRWKAQQGDQNDDSSGSDSTASGDSGKASSDPVHA